VDQNAANVAPRNANHAQGRKNKNESERKGEIWILEKDRRHLQKKKYEVEKRM
tara:strand:- start:101 stop:259 length:159 start_codon:yes stop_codon:yes gene_type:complete